MIAGFFSNSMKMEFKLAPSPAIYCTTNMTIIENDFT